MKKIFQFNLYLSLWNVIYSDFVQCQNYFLDNGDSAIKVNFCENNKSVEEKKDKSVEKTSFGGQYLRKMGKRKKHLS